MADTLTADQLIGRMKDMLAWCATKLRHEFASEEIADMIALAARWQKQQQGRPAGVFPVVEVQPGVIETLDDEDGTAPAAQPMERRHCKGDLCQASWRMGGCECDCYECVTPAASLGKAPPPAATPTTIGEFMRGYAPELARQTGLPVVYTEPCQRCDGTILWEKCAESGCQRPAAMPTAEQQAACKCRVVMTDVSECPLHSKDRQARQQSTAENLLRVAPIITDPELLEVLEEAGGLEAEQAPPPAAPPYMHDQAQILSTSCADTPPAAPAT